jgi:hypothetical protein
MSAHAVAKHYDRLTPDERFRLSLAAIERGDESEQERLSQAGKDLVLSMPDLAPWSHAFDELAMLIFMELLEEAAKHRQAFERWCDADESWGEDEADEDQSPSAESIRPMKARCLDLYLAQGFMLATKVDGWKLFCQRLNIPPFALWQHLPGFDRLQLAIELLQDNEFRPGPAFRPEAMLRYLRSFRDQPEPSPENLICPERLAADLDSLFRQRVQWWGG